jgi:dTDP-4-dehydrorhamnose 3,5-epimerase
MQVKETGFEGLVELSPAIYKDNRGWFYEFYNEKTFQQANIMPNFVQENTSFSKKGVIRGLHFQKPPYSQAKLVTVHAGKVLDVVVDMRKHSKTFGKYYSCVLDDVRRNMMMIPEGFAHGFAALEDSIFYYKCTNFYNKASEAGIVWNDQDLKIEWPFANPIVSDKDQVLPTFEELVRNSVISPN